jgi:4-diphosphocytidyl-2-C-methyl-D-erythritol kinase
MDAQLDNRPWPAPAKLNLFLHIVGRRADGYHLLQTAFQFIDLNDELRFEVTPAGRIERLGALEGVEPERDLTVRAARALQAATGCPLGARIDCIKRIPMGGGLGGGSSDAATTLVALNTLWKTGLDVDALAAIGIQLGADVPVFVRGHAAWAEGVGEHLTRIDPPEPWYVVIHPQVHVSTAEIFGLPELTRHCPTLRIRDFFAGQGINVCESVVRARYPAVAQALDWAVRFGPTRMTGTGACVFTRLPDAGSAHAMLREVPPAWRGFAAKGMNTSPLVARAEAARIV